MVARVAISTAGQNGQYVGTTRIPTPTASPGSSTCRSFNGTSDRLILGPSNSLGPTYLAVCSFWRGDGSVLPDDQTASRIFTQYAVGGTRVGVGLNRSFLSLTFMAASGSMYTVESKARVLDTNRHILGIEVRASDIRVFLDGRLAIRAETTLSAPDLARVCVGADTTTRFFKGAVDDLAVFPTYPSKTQNWLRYYRDLVRGVFGRDYQAATFATGFHSVTLSDENFTATGFSTAPASRVAVATALRTEPELPQQFVEFRFQAGSGLLKLGVMNTNHDLEQDDLGTTANSYAYTTEGKLVLDNQEVASGFGTWSPDNIMALGWDVATRALTLWKDGTQVHSLNLPAGTWIVAVSLGGHTAFMNSGQGVPLSLPTDTPGLPIKAWSKLTTEFRQMKLAEVCAPLDDLDAFMLDAYTGNQVGVYTAPLVPAAGFTVDGFDVARRVGGGIKVDFGSHTAADDDFFFALAFTPEESDMAGEVVLLESPGKWGLRLIDGQLNAWVGSVQVGSVNQPFTAGDRYILGIARSAAGKLLVWTHIGYILQSGDVTTVQAAGDVFVGSAGDGSKAFAGRLSHLVLSSKLPATWKMNRLKGVYTWDVPDVEGMIPNPSDVRQAFELSWRDVIATGISATPTSTNCYVGTVAREPDAIAIEYRPVDRKGAAAYAGDNIATWAPMGQLLQFTDRETEEFLLSSANDLDTVSVGTAALVGNEIVRVTAINTTTLIIHVKRGCADTIPAEHGAGTRVWFYDTHVGSSRNNYAVLDAVDVKMLSRSALAEMGEEFAPVDVVAMQGRLNRPYPPARVTINEQSQPTELSGTVYIQWAHRNKVVQAGNLSGWTEGTFTAPAGLTYKVRAYNADTGELLHESTPVAGTDTDYNLLVEGYVGNLTVTVASVQGGLECLQVPSFSFAYSGEVTVVLATEEGEGLGDEEGASLAAEYFTAIRAGSYSGELPDDWEGQYEEEEEEEEGLGGTGGVVAGIPISELPQLTTEPTGDEMFPIAINGTNYYVTFTQYLNWLVANSPQPENGKDAYELWLEDGNTGTLEDFFEAYRGYQGLNSNSSRRIQNVTSASGAIICNWALYDEIRLRLTGPVTLTFQGALDGQGCLLKLTQTGVGNHAVTLPAGVRYNALVQNYTPSPTAGLSDKIGFIYDSGDGKYDFVTFVPGFS